MSVLTRREKIAKDVNITSVEIGQGAYSKVYRVDSLAVKVIDISDSRKRKTFDTEGEVSSILQDVEGVVKVCKVKMSEGGGALVMEYFQHGDLEKYVLSNGPLKEDEAIRVFKQIVDIMYEAHSRGVYHQDLKPENILVVSVENYAISKVNVCDWGLSLFGPIGPERNFCGSMLYASPEKLNQTQGHDLSKSEVWSLAHILYFMLEGKDIYHNAVDRRDLLIKIFSQQVFPSHFGEKSKTLLSRMLVVVPQNRISLLQLKNHEYLQ